MLGSADDSLRGKGSVRACGRIPGSSGEELGERGGLEFRREPGPGDGEALAASMN